MADVNRLVRGVPPVWNLPKQTTTLAIEVGDMVKLSSGVLELADTLTDNLAFVGIASTASPANDSRNVTVYQADGTSVFRMVLDTATSAVPGAKFSISNDNSDAKTLRASLAAGTDAVAVLEKTIGTSDTTGLFKFLLPQALTIGDAS